MQYSFKKGASKGLVHVLQLAAALAVFAGFSDLQLWDLVTTYVKPVLGTLSVGGVLAIALNWAKVRSA